MSTNMKKLLAAFGLVFVVQFGACVINVPPAPPTPSAPPVVRLVQATIRGLSEGALSGVTVTLSTDTPGSDLSCLLVVSRAVCTLDDRYPIGHTASEVYQGYLTVQAPDFQTKVVRLLLTGNSQDLDDVKLEPTFITLPELIPSGQHFRLSNGGRITLIGATEFNLFARFVNGEDVVPVFEQLYREHYNYIRVFTAFDVCPTGNGCQQIGRLIPREHPDLYTKIPSFVRLASTYGVYVEFVAFTGPYDTIFANDDEKVAHWNSFIVAVASSLPNRTAEMVNEGDHVANHNIPFDRLRRPVGVISSHGSSTEDAQPVWPYWDYITFHPAHGPEWWRKVGHNCMELWDGPCVSNETERYADQDKNPNHAFDAGAGCALLSAGCVFHSVEGKAGLMWTSALDGAHAWAQGELSVPLNCQDGPYGNAASPAPLLRIYSRGPEPCVVRMRP